MHHTETEKGVLKSIKKCSTKSGVEEPYRPAQISDMNHTKPLW